MPYLKGCYPIPPFGREDMRKEWGWWMGEGERGKAEMGATGDRTK